MSPLIFILLLLKIYLLQVAATTKKEPRTWQQLEPIDGLELIAKDPSGFWYFFYSWFRELVVRRWRS